MAQESREVLVTGGAGYIGSHVVKKLKQDGFCPVVVDNLVYGHRSTVESLEVPFYHGDIADRSLLDRVFSSHDIRAVMHFSAYAYVGESVVDPRKYYQNNVVSTLQLLECMLDNSVKDIVFSSTCAVYGVAQSVPIGEAHTLNPINPYGRTKLTIENALRDYAAYGLNHVIFRYFNAAGADPDGEIGERHTPETHLIPLVLRAALFPERGGLTVFGDDYDTPDGTCIRDYIHVDDLAVAHILGLVRLLDKHESLIVNLGNARGYSVKEVIAAAEQTTGLKVPYAVRERRTGDPPVLIGDNRRAFEQLGWSPGRSDLGSIMLDAWNWEVKLRDMGIND